jgi:hypothetical protein
MRIKAIEWKCNRDGTILNPKLRTGISASFSVTSVRPFGSRIGSSNGADQDNRAARYKKAPD